MYNNACNRVAFRPLLILLMALSPLLLASCENVEKEAKYPTGYDRNTTGGDIYAEPESIFGEGGLMGINKSDPGEEGGNIGVNTFLWRASLDTVSFMPLASADPFGGVILTDWYTPPENASERFKINVFILGRTLRSDGVRVRVFRQALVGGTWKDAEVDPATATQLEDTILTRARQLRVAQLGAVED
jgi:hypothetical protein